MGLEATEWVQILGVGGPASESYESTMNETDGTHNNVAATFWSHYQETLAQYDKVW